MLSTSLDGTAKVWDVQDGKLVMKIENDFQVWFGAFSPEDTRLAIIDDSGSCSVWNLDGELSSRSQNHRNSAKSLLWINQDVVTGGADGIVHWWNPNTGEKRKIEFDSAINAMAYDKVTNKLLVTKGGWNGMNNDPQCLVRIDLATGNVLQLEKDFESNVVITADGGKLLYGNALGKILVFDLKAETMLVKNNLTPLVFTELLFLEKTKTGLISGSRLPSTARKCHSREVET